jgi:hypothetical protein
MVRMDKLQRIEEKIKLLLDAIDKEEHISDTIYYGTLLEVYMERYLELKKQLEQ